VLSLASSDNTPSYKTPLTYCADLYQQSNKVR
jgi:hypothetical protein